MTTPADELRAAAEKLRDLATRTSTTLQRHEAQWEDLAISNTAPDAKASPMVWSYYVSAMNPTTGLAVAEWLDIERRLHECDERLGCADCVATPNALAVARAINGGEQR